jgi:hypothetical protein
MGMVLVCGVSSCGVSGGLYHCAVVYIMLVILLSVRVTSLFTVNVISIKVKVTHASQSFSLEART